MENSAADCSRFPAGPSKTSVTRPWQNRILTCHPPVRSRSICGSSHRPICRRTGNCHLLCKKYVSHNDYQLLLTIAENGLRRLQLALGFGNDSETFFSDAVEWPADTWQHVAVTYDGAGTARFHRNGESLGGRTAPGRRSISPGPLPLSIGDRTGSLYSGFAGVLDQIRISRGVREFGRVRHGVGIGAPRLRPKRTAADSRCPRHEPAAGTPARGETLGGAVRTAGQ